MVRLLAVFPAVVLLQSCGERPETTTYFSQVTGLPLCSEASVRNVNARAPDRSTGFDSIYIVDVAMPAACKATFAKAVGQHIGAKCEPSDGCSGSAKNGDFYAIDPLPVGFRVTYST